MADYIYTRNLVDGSYDINNIADVDGGGNQVFLFKAIQVEGTLPTEFTINCNESNCTITFSITLSGPQQTALNSTVATQQSYRAGE